MKAEIFYYTNELPLPYENKYWGSLYKILHYRENPTPFTMKIGFFKRYWRKLPMKEEVQGNYDLELLFGKYNRYEDNPYSKMREGQRNIQELNTHTSMSIGDVIKIGKTYYIVSNVGFRKLVLR